MLQKIVISGEGPTDMGSSNSGQGVCSGKQLDVGPIARLLFKLIQQHLPDWNIDNLALDDPAKHMTLLSKAWVKAECKDKRRGSVRPSKAIQKGMLVYAQRAQALGNYARENDYQMAAYFHDTDGTNRQLTDIPDLQEKLSQAIKEGFRAARFEDKGLALVPKPTSEAWLICGVKEEPYQHCGLLESTLSGNDASPERAPKTVLGKLIRKANYNRSDLNDLAEQLNVNQIDMPSFNSVRDQVKTAIQSICG